MNDHPPLDRRTAAEVMTTDLLSVAADESVLMAWELMTRARIHHLPVVDAHGHCLGVLDAPTITLAWDATGPGRARKPVSSLLPRQPATTRPQTPLPQVARTMLRSGADHLQVTDDDGTLLGLITAHDLIAALAGNHPRVGGDRSAMPSLYRIEPIMPERPD